MDCKEKVKQKKSAGKEENCKICVKRQRSFGKEDFYENKVKRQQNSGKAELCEDGVKRQQEATAIGNRERRRAVAADGIRWEATAEAGDNTRQATGTRQVVPERKMTTTMRGGRGMVEKEGRQIASHAVKRRKPHQSAVKAISTYY